MDKRILIGTSANTIIELSADKNKKKVLEKAHEKSIFGIKYNQGHFLSVSADGHFKQWNNELVETDNIVAHMYAIHDVVFRPDNHLFATCSMDKTIKIWETKTNKLLKVIDAGRFGAHKSSVNKLWWSPFNDQLVSCSDDRKIMIWEINIDDNV